MAGRYVRRGELRGLASAFLLHFFLLASYYVLRPMREEIGAEHRHLLEWLWTGTFLGMLVAVPAYSALVSRLPRRRFLPLVYRAFLVFVLVFYGLLLGLPADLARWVEWTYYVFVSVFNLFVVSVFWGFLADLFRNERARRQYGLIASGGTVGGVVGSWLAGRLAGNVDPVHLLLLAAVLLEGAARCVRVLERSLAAEPLPAAPAPRADEADRPVEGGVWTGAGLVLRSPYLLGIATYLFLFTLTSTFLYYEQSHIVGEAVRDRARRTVFYADLNLTVNGLTLMAQWFLTAGLVRRFGLRLLLVLLPAVNVLGFVWLGTLPLLAVFATFEVTRRLANFAFAKPAREVLYTVLGRVEKYKSKAFLDTVVYRGGDLVNAWFFRGLQALGLGLGAIALTAVPFACAWGLVGLYLAVRHDRLAAKG